MKYLGKYKIFNTQTIKTYPISTRMNKVHIDHLIKPADVVEGSYSLPDDILKNIEAVADAVTDAANNKKPVILFAGAHLIKNGLNLFLTDLVNKKLITLVAGNGATAIHDFELALIGQTSEYVPQALEKGQFGMAYEFCYQNIAIELGNKYKLGYGESLGKMICDDSFRKEVLTIAANENSPTEFANPKLSVLAACYKNNIPFTAHVGIGTDVIDQHISFDGRAKGGCSGRDFLIYTQEVAKLTNGGVVLNVGSAVTGPEVFLKAASITANIGKVPNNIITADFDIRHHNPEDMTDESSQGYYFRDQKSVVTRIPKAYNGAGHYIQGNMTVTIPMLYKKIIERL